MKKIISILVLATCLSILIFTGYSYATSLDTINVQTDKTTVRPGNEVKVDISFGQELGSYTFEVSYDNHIFDYVSADGGTANDTGNKIKLTFYDATGGTSARSNVSITFRAKTDITTSNPTEFLVTAESLANPDSSIQFDDITTPIVKNVTVEPEYVDYVLKLETIGEIVKNEEKPMNLSFSSPIGHYYEHARLIAEATTPAGATVQLLANDQTNLEYDIIQSGWGNAQGFKIGGKDVLQSLQTRAIFSHTGDYTITLKLIDRDNSDQVIAQETFAFTALEMEAPVLPENMNPKVAETEEVKTEEMPTKLPKTGNNIYIPILVVLMILVSSYIYYNKKKD